MGCARTTVTTVAEGLSREEIAPWLVNAREHRLASMDPGAAAVEAIAAWLPKLRQRACSYVPGDHPPAGTAPSRHYP